VWIQLHPGIIYRDDVEGFHRSIGGAHPKRFRNFVSTAIACRQLLKVRHLLVQHAHDAPSALGEFRHPTVQMDVVAGLQPRAPCLWHDEVIPFGNADVDGMGTMRTVVKHTIKDERRTGLSTRDARGVISISLLLLIKVVHERGT
jgi:hypothetical protein